MKRARRGRGGAGKATRNPAEGKERGREGGKEGVEECCSRRGRERRGRERRGREIGREGGRKKGKEGVREEGREGGPYLVGSA